MPFSLVVMSGSKSRRARGRVDARAGVLDLELDRARAPRRPRTVTVPAGDAA